MSKAKQSMQAKYAALLEPKPKAAELLELQKQAILLFGEAGSGKTSIAAQIPDHLYLDFEKSATNHQIVEPAQGRPRSWASFVELVEALEAVPELPYKTVVLDTVTDAWRMCRVHVLAQRNLKAEPDQDYGKTRGAMRDEFMRVLEKLLSMQADGKLGLVWIAHEKEKVTSVTATESLTGADPDAKDKELASWLAAKVQLALRVRKCAVHPITGQQFVTDQGDAMVRHLIECNSQAPGSMVKDRTRRLPTWVNASWGALERAYAAGNAPQGTPVVDTTNEGGAS